MSQNSSTPRPERQAAASAVHGEGPDQGKGDLRSLGSSAGVYRGSWGSCSASLLWDPTAGAARRIVADTLDSPTGLQLVQPIDTANASDNHSIDPALPQSPAGAMLAPIPDANAPDTVEVT